MKKILRQPRVILCLGFLLFFLLWLGMESEAFARAGGGRSSGSRGSTPSRSYQQSPRQSPAQAPQQKNLQQQPSPGTGRSFFSGIAGGLMGGFLGAMLFRSLGFADGGGMGEGGFGFGDIFLILIILGIIYFVVKKFRSRGAMQMSMAGAGAAPYSYPQPYSGPTYIPPSSQEPPLHESIGQTKAEGLHHIKEMDPSFSENNFRDLAQDIFFKIQGGWTKRELKGIRHLLTPDMFNTFQQDVNNLIAAKQINRLENIAVREVEMVDAGQDRGEDFITVKFYANLLDYVLDETNGQVLSGSSTDPVKFLEYWTFSRNAGEKNWVLAGIHQERDY
ncbi:MAG: Tim44 domain-containing protein [Deltaproteobacteria bacterium]|nr:Tim44 domain-containing protein [Deltaproteobacteria bacterium]